MCFLASFRQMWPQILMFVMCLDLSKYLTLLSLSVLSCQMGKTTTHFVGLLGGLGVICRKARVP